MLWVAKIASLTSSPNSNNSDSSQGIGITPAAADHQYKENYANNQSAGAQRPPRQVDKIKVARLT